MGRVALLAVALTGASGLFTLQSDLARSRQADDRYLQEERLGVLAREAALSGYTEALLAVLHADPTLTRLPTIVTETASGRYRADVTVTPGVPYDVHVRVTADAQAGAAASVRHVLDVRLRDADGREGTADSDALLGRVPPYLRYALFSDQALNLVLLPRIVGRMFDLNANVHTNGNLGMLLSLNQLLGGSSVSGFGTYAGALQTLPLISGTDRAFRPPTNPTGTASLRRTATVPMPALDIPAMAAAHATRTEPGTLRLLGRTTLGTRERPEVVHVRGDLVLVDSRIEGYGTFLVDGNVIVESTVTGLLGIVAGQPESHVAYYAGGSVLFNGIGDVQGQFAANGSVTFSAAPTLYGSIAARGSVNLLVAPTIRFVPPSPALTLPLPGNPASADLRRLTYREWRVSR